MADIQVIDRVKVSSTSTGTGSFTLSNTPDPGGFQNFSALDGARTYYTIVNPATGEWETGLGTFTQSTLRLTRTVVYEGSNGPGYVVNFGPGTKTVFCGESAQTASPGGWMLLAESEIPTGAITTHLFAFEGMGTTLGVDSKFAEYKVVIPSTFGGWYCKFTATSSLTPIAGNYQTRIAANFNTSYTTYNYSNSNGVMLIPIVTNYSHIEARIAGVRMENSGNYYPPVIYATCMDAALNASTRYYAAQTFNTGTGAFIASDISGIELRNYHSLASYYAQGAKIRFYGLVA
jgi:hypothetical protein